MNDEIPIEIMNGAKRASHMLCSYILSGKIHMALSDQTKSVNFRDGLLSNKEFLELFDETDMNYDLLLKYSI